MISSEGIGGNTFSRNISKAMPNTPVVWTIASIQLATLDLPWDASVL